MALEDGLNEADIAQMKWRNLLKTAGFGVGITDAFFLFAV